MRPKKEEKILHYYRLKHKKNIPDRLAIGKYILDKINFIIKDYEIEEFKDKEFIRHIRYLETNEGGKRTCQPII